MIYMQKGWYHIVNERKTSVFSNGLLWFGAGISIAEILTGMLLAPLGFAKAFAAIILGHLIGGTVMYLAGLIGGRTGGSAMETVRISFGTQGAKLFAGLNVIQLVGWTAVMVASAALAANTIAAIGVSWWSLIIGAFIALWIVMGLTFGCAVELAVAMPLSWLPIISDYTRTAEKPGLATAASCSAYFIASSWMFLIGMGAALFTGQDDIAAIMVQAGMGVAGILVVLLSTVTTTFLDAFSAGVSCQSLVPKVSDKVLALIATVLGVILAIFAAPDQFQDFLYLIGSVFAPMTAILLSDFFILKQDHTADSVNWLNLVLWVLGVILYRFLLNVDTPVGITVPVVVILMVISALVHKVLNKA